MSSSNVNHLSHPGIYGRIIASYEERKSRFMKWLSKLFKSGGSSRGESTGGQQPQFPGDENMGEIHTTKSCFNELTHPKCDVCHQFIPRNRVGLIEYGCHPFWSQKYCPSHEHDHTAPCCCCERLEPWNARYTSLEDGRSLCAECMESAIMVAGDCQPLYHAIRDFYEGMNMRIDQQIPMLLVEKQVFDDDIKGEKHGFHDMPETTGLCLSEQLTVPAEEANGTLSSSRNKKVTEGNLYA